jgi:hypothetical protein
MLTIFYPEALDMIVTVPSYQGKGMARAHIDWGIELSKAEHLPIFIEATPAGYSLYLKTGFLLLKEAKLDLTLGGGKGAYSHYMMVRPCE